jgi:hypothetical protein
VKNLDQLDHVLNAHHSKEPKDLVWNVALIHVILDKGSNVMEHVSTVNCSLLFQAMEELA